MGMLQSMSPQEVLALSILLALSACDDLSLNELNVLGNLLSAVGSLISTWTAQQQLLNESCRDDELKKLNDRFDEFRKDCENIRNAQKNMTGGGKKES